MGDERNASRPLLSHYTATVKDPAAVFKTVPHRQKSFRPLLPTDDLADPARDSVTPANVHPGRDAWNPWLRYWSNKNCFPEYGSTKETMKSVSALGDFFRGNNLNGQRPTTAADALPTNNANKRTPEPTVTASKPAKRPRTSDDDVVVIHEVHSRAGSSEAHEGPQPAGSPSNRTANHGSGSLRSSGEHTIKGSEIQEYRNATKYTQKGGVRSRHRKRVGDTSHTRVDGDRDIKHARITSTQPPFKGKGLMISRSRKDPEDPIDDDDEVQDVAGSPPAKKNGRPKSQFSSTTFVHESSEDEINAIQTKTKIQDSMTSSVRPGNKNNGVKRSAGSPDELQEESAAKRLSVPLSSTDIRRTIFATSPNEDGRGTDVLLKVDKAVCVPGFIYPAKEGMHENAKGACNDSCYLRIMENDSRGFKPVTSLEAQLSVLEWMTPDISKMTHIGYNESLEIVRVGKKTDVAAALPTGAVLFIQFSSPSEAMIYINLCRRINNQIMYRSIYRDDLESLMNKKTQEVKNNNMKKPIPRTPDVPLDVQYMEHQAIQSNHGRRKNATKPSQATTQQNGHFADMKALRAKMRAGDSERVESITSKATSEVRTPKTPAEEGEMRKLIDFDDVDGDEGNEDRPMGSSETPSRPNDRPPASKTQRSLRSSMPTARSPTPPLERWTEKNPNWVQERNYKIPLVYERTTVAQGDIERLDEGQFLNDEIISFYSKYLHKKLEERDVQTAKKVYVFNSFFWDKLKTKGYEGVKNWTAKIDLLSFDYIIVPINQSAHWYLAIICNPAGLLQDSEIDADIGVNEQETNSDHPTESAPEAKVANITSDVSHISIEDQSIASHPIDLEEIKKTSGAKKGKASKKGPGPRKYDPKAPRVITLDSLDGNHSNVATTLRTYLVNEIKTRKGISIVVPSPFGTQARDIPMQKNFTDCGVYLLGYIEEFMKDPHKFTRNILQHEGRDWDINAPALRNHIRDLIFELQKRHQQDHVRERRVKKLQATEKRSLPGGQTGNTSSPPGVASEQLSQSLSISTEKSPQENARAQNSPIRNLDGGRKHKPRGSISPPPSKRTHDTPGASRTNEIDAASVNASMIVHPNESVEIVDRGTAIIEDTPRVVPSVEIIDHSQEALLPKTSSAPQQSIKSSARQESPCENYDERKFLPPMPSSSEISRSPSKESTDHVEDGGSANAEEKHVAPKHDNIRSPYFPKTSVRFAPLKLTAKPTSNRTGNIAYESVDSDDEERLARAKAQTQAKFHVEETPKRKTAQKQQYMIDLTDD